MKHPTLFRRIASTLVLAAALALPTGAALAQGAPDAAPRPGRGGGRPQRDFGEHLEQRLQRMTQELGLSAAQQAQIRQIFAEARQRRQALRPQGGEPTVETRRAMMQLRWDLQDRVHAVLTQQQRDRMRQMRRERMLQRMEEGGGRFRGHHGRGRWDGRGRGGRGRGADVPPGAV